MAQQSPNLDVSTLDLPPAAEEDAAPAAPEKRGSLFGGAATEGSRHRSGKIVRQEPAEATGPPRARGLLWGPVFRTSG